MEQCFESGYTEEGAFVATIVDKDSAIFADCKETFEEMAMLVQEAIRRQLGRSSKGLGRVW